MGHASRERERENSAGSRNRYGEELDREFCKNPANRKLRTHFIKCIKNGLVTIDHKESTVTQDGMVALTIQDPTLSWAKIHFELYKRLRAIALGEIVDKDWSGYYQSRSGGYWKEDER